MECNETRTYRAQGRHGHATHSQQKSVRAAAPIFAPTAAHVSSRVVHGATAGIAS